MGAVPPLHPRAPPELPGAPAQALRGVAGRRRPRPGPHPARGPPHPPARAHPRDAHHAGTLERATLAAEADRLGAQLDKLLAGATRYPPNRRLLNHLANEREHLFTFLRVPGVQATNWRAEQAIRPAVVTRKIWGGNRTWAGADTWQVLTSVLRTATQQGRDPLELLTHLLRAPTPTVANLAIPGH